MTCISAATEDEVPSSTDEKRSMKSRLKIFFKNWIIEEGRKFLAPDKEEAQSTELSLSGGGVRHGAIWVPQVGRRNTGLEKKMDWVTSP